MEGLHCIFCGEEDALRVICSSGLAHCAQCDTEAEMPDIARQIECLQRLKIVMVAAMPATVPAVPKEAKPHA